MSDGSHSGFSHSGSSEGSEITSNWTCGLDNIEATPELLNGGVLDHIVMWCTRPPAPPPGAGTRSVHWQITFVLQQVTAYHSITLNMRLPDQHIAQIKGDDSDNDNGTLDFYITRKDQIIAYNGSNVMMNYTIPFRVAGEIWTIQDVVDLFKDNKLKLASSYVFKDSSERSGDDLRFYMLVLGCMVHYKKWIEEDKIRRFYMEIEGRRLILGDDADKVIPWPDKRAFDLDGFMNLVLDFPGKPVELLG